MTNARRFQASVLGGLVVALAAGLIAFALLAPSATAPFPESPLSESRAEEVQDRDRLAEQVEPRDPDAERELVLATQESAAKRPDSAPTRFTLRLKILDVMGQLIPDARADLSGPDEATVIWKRLATGIELEVDRPGRYDLTIDGPELNSESAAPFTAESFPWQVTPDKPHSDAEIVLHRAARIVGSFHCTDGSSPRSAGIDIFHVATETWSNAAAIDDGTFVSSWMPAGEVIVYSRNGSWSDTDLKDREVLTLAEGQSHAYHGALAPAIDLTGTIIDTAGRPLAGISVDVYDERNPAYSESVLSEQDGQFLCDGLYPGVYLLDLPRSKETPKARFEVQRGRTRVDMGNLVFRRD